MVVSVLGGAFSLFPLHLLEADLITEIVGVHVTAEVSAVAGNVM